MNPDPSGVGGLCRVRCHSYRNPAACCAAKRGLCTDADCDVRAGTYTGRWTPTATSAPARVPRPVECSAWATSCSAYVDAGACCASKPTLCYDSTCIGGRYAPQSLPKTRVATAKPGGMVGWCPAATPCQMSPDREECCRRKNPGCDPSCDAARAQAWGSGAYAQEGWAAFQPKGPGYFAPILA